MSSITSIALLFILGVDWASGYAIARYCMTHGVAPYGYAFWQSFGPFCLLLIIQALRRDLWLEKSGVIYALFCALTGIVIPNLLIYYAAIRIPSGILTVIANISPIFTYILALFFRNEKFSWPRLAFVMLGLIGTMLIVVPNQRLLIVNFGNFWLYIALLIPLNYAFSAVYIARFHPATGNILTYAVWMLMFSTLMISPLAVINHGYYALQFGDTNSLLIVLEIILSTWGYILLFIIIRKTGAVYYSLVNAIAAVSGVAYGYFIFKEQFSLATYGAVAVILIAIGGLSYFQNFKNQC